MRYQVMRQDKNPDFPWGVYDHQIGGWAEGQLDHGEADDLAAELASPVQADAEPYRSDPDRAYDERREGIRP